MAIKLTHRVGMSDDRAVQLLDALRNAGAAGRPIEEPSILFNEGNVSKRVTYWPCAFIRRVR